MRPPPVLPVLPVPPPALLVLVLAVVPGGVSPYGFRNCLQSPWDAGRFRCVRRWLTAPAAAVADLPPAAVTSLNLSGNAFRRLPAAAFARLPRLRALDLAHNRLEAAAPGAFAGLAALETLDLAHNRLAALADGVFVGLANLTWLRLDHNPLAALAPGVLAPLANLRRLGLRGARVAALGAVAAAVAALRRLEALDLCGNAVAALGPAPPLPPALEALSLCNNSLAEMAGAGPGTLPPALRVLDLSYNNISAAAAVARLSLRGVGRLRLAGNAVDVFRLLELSDLRPRSLDFSGLRLGGGGVAAACRALAGPPVRELRFRRNGIEALEAGALAGCPAAATLDLSRNRLRRLECAGRLLAPAQRRALGELRVEHNLLRWLPSCRETPVLRRLHNISLRFNRILTVGPGAFAHAPRLRSLRLDVNGLARLDRRALAGLPELRELRLDNNLLTDVFPGSFAGLRRLRTLNLRNNRVAVLFPGAFAGLARLRTLDLGGNNLRHLAAAALRGLRGLRRLYLDRNRLQEVSAAPFRPVEASLGVLDLRANALRYAPRRPRRRPPPFRRLRRLYDLKLQAQQPYGLGAVPPRFFQGLAALRSLYLAQNRLLDVPADAFDDLAELRYLTLADSAGGMGALPAGVFKNLTRLRELDVENAGLRALGADVLANLTRLERLRAARNELRALDAPLDAWLPALRYLDLRRCPWSCSCANAWLPAWLARSPAQAVGLYELTCGSRRPAAFLHRFDARVCFPDAGLYLFAATAPAVLLASALPVLLHRASWRLRYYLLLLRARLGCRRRRRGRRFAFDGFVSYSSADERWVLEELVPQVEGAALRLCLHQRDFAPGRAVVDNIVAGIYGSRATLCVVSRRFLRSAWCALELQLASHRLLAERRAALLLVFLERVPDAELSAFHRMRRVLLRRPHLRWPPQPQARPLFWERLRRALRGDGDGDEDEEEGR